MARYMTFEPESSYRAVILKLYNPMACHFDLPAEPKIYINAEGEEFRYHYASAYGPYSKRGLAKAQLTRELEYVGNGHRSKELAEVHAFTEETVMQWGNVLHVPVDLSV